MLKSHRNLLEPRPSDRLRIGERVIDVPLREIAPLAGGEAMRITLKSLGVLLVLVAHAGRPVSREALLEWVWPDTLPTDDVITQAITQLRKALGDDREHPRYIETLAKQGYRLIAPVEWLADPERAPVPVAAAAATAPRRARRVWAVVDTLGVLALIAAMGAWLWSRRPEASTPAPQTPAVASAGAAASVPVQRIATSPLSEGAPSLSPDGALLVYTRHREDGRGAALMLQTASAVPPRALTESAPDRWDMSPAWAPDGRQIAFLRSEDARCRILLVAATGGTPREIGDCLPGAAEVAWFPDGRALVGGGATPDENATSTDGRRLQTMRIDEGVWRPIAYARRDEDIDMRPRVSPDGRWIAFQRNLSLGDLWRIPVAGGTPERITRLRTNFFGLAWTPDSGELVYGRYRSDGVVLVRQRLADGATAEYRLPGSELTSPTVALRGDRVAFVIEQSQSQLHTARIADGAQAHARGEVLFPSTRSDLLPAVSPDGRQLLFLSDRDGAMRVWWAELARPDSLRAVEGVEPMPRFPPVWNADSTRALVVADHADGRKTAVEIDPRLGRVRTLPVPDAVPVHLSWHPDPGRLLVVAERGQGRLGLTLYDRTVEPWRPLARIEDVMLAFADPAAKRIVFVRPFKPELWQADLDLGHPRPVDRVAAQWRIRTLVPQADGIRVLDSTPDCGWRWRRVAGGAGPEDARCVGDEPRSTSGVSFLPDDRLPDDGLPAGGRVLVATTDTAGMDIGQLPLSALPLPPPGKAAPVKVSSPE